MLEKINAIRIENNLHYYKIIITSRKPVRCTGNF